jgi:hypothetical protein
MPFRNPADTQLDLPASLTQRELIRIIRQVIRTEQSIPITGSALPRSVPLWTPQAGLVFPAIVSGAITPCSNSAYGSGNVAIYYSDLPEDTNAAGDLDNQSVPCLNWYKNSGTLNSNTRVMCAMGWGGRVWLLGADC